MVRSLTVSFHGNTRRGYSKSRALRSPSPGCNLTITALKTTVCQSFRCCTPKMTKLLEWQRKDVVNGTVSLFSPNSEGNSKVRNFCSAKTFLQDERSDSEEERGRENKKRRNGNRKSKLKVKVWVELYKPMQRHTEHHSSFWAYI